MFYILFSVQFIAMHFIILFYFYVCSCKIKLKLTCMSVYSGPAGFSLYYKFLVFFSVIIFIFYDLVVILSQIVTVNHKSLSITNESKMSLYVTRQLILRQTPKLFKFIQFTEIKTYSYIFKAQKRLNKFAATEITPTGYSAKNLQIN